MTVEGFKIGFIAATDNEPDFVAGEDKPGSNYLRINLQQDTLTHLEEDIQRAKAQGAQLIILSLHWGPNMVQAPGGRFRSFAQKAIEMGVDIIHGHSAHLFHGIEFYQNGVIFYDTGDFLDDYATDPDLRNDWSFVFLIELKDQEIHKVKARPVLLEYAQTNMATGLEAQEIMARMVKLCEPFGTIAKITANEIEFSKAST